MSCIEPNCLPSTPAGAGLNVVNTPQRSCSGETFCDDRLEGLPFAAAVDLTGVPEGDKCLNRIAAPKGIWQHDPAHAGGSDFVGPLESVQFKPGASAGTGECGQIPILRKVGTDAVEIAPQNLTERSDGEIGLINKCPGGEVRQDILEVEEFDNDNPCEANLSFLGYVLRTVIVNGKNVSQKVWKQITRLLFPATQLTELGEPNYSDGANWRRAAWKKNGICWELGLTNADATTPDCSTYDSTGASFPYLLACDAGAIKKVEPTNGMGLVGDGTNWQVKRVAMTRIPRYFVGQKNSGFTTTTNIVGVTDTTGVTSGTTSGTFNMTILPGYVAGSASIVWIRGVVIVNTNAPGEALAQVKCGGEVMLEAWIDSNLAVGYINTMAFPVAVVADEFPFELVTSASNANVVAWAKIEIIGYQ